MNRFTGWIMKLEILLALGFFLYQPTIPLQPVIHQDARIGQLTNFEIKHHFAPDQFKYVKQIIQDADSNSISPAFLVCIELSESSGGKRFNHDSHNPFGWDSGKKDFASERAAIDYISAKLGHGAYYASKSIKSKLNAYNPNPAYALRVMACMKEINVQ